MDFIEKYKIENQRRLSVLSKKQKRMLALMCLERQFKVYEKTAQDKEWSRTNDYRQLLDICWDAVLCDKAVNESIWEKHERIKPENVNKNVKEYMRQEFCYANIFSTNVMEFLENLLDDNGNEEAFRLLNFDFILSFLNENNEHFTIDEYEDNNLVIQEMKMQEQDEIEIQKISCLDDVIRWNIKCRSLI